jgi:hypothetical protein
VKYDGPPSLVFDLETFSIWGDLSPSLQDGHLKAHAKREAGLHPALRGQPSNDPIEMAAVSPWTSRIIVACVYDPSADFGRVLYHDPDGLPLKESPFELTPCGSEREIIEHFWAICAKRPGHRLVGWNSWRFDAYFLKVRTEANELVGVRWPTPKPWETNKHFDLRRAYQDDGFGVPSLAVVAETFGIKTPKHDLDGSQVGAAYLRGECLRIARYCAEDVRCTAEVLAHWHRSWGDAYEANEGRRR